MPPISMDESNAETTDSKDFRWRWLSRVGGMAALFLFVLFLIGVIFIPIGLQPSTTGGWFASLQNNWLIVLFKLNIEFSGIGPDSLNIVNPLDIGIMVLFGTMALALYPALRSTHKLWSAIAVSLAFLGIPVLLITSTAGRSGLLLAGLIISAVMLRSTIFIKTSAYVGIVASALLFFVGDIGTTIFSSSSVIAILIGIGYVLWMIWFVQIARRLFRLGRLESSAFSQPV